MQRFKICVGSHEEDIQAWIEERRKKFPTRKRVLEKEEKKKKRKRGEVLGSASMESSMTRDAKQIKRNVDGAHGEDKTKTDKSEESLLTNLMAGYSDSSDGENSDCDKGAGTQKQQDKEKDTNVMNAKNEESMPKDVDAAVDCPPKFKTRHCRFFTRNGTCKNGDDCTYIHDMEHHKEFKLNQQNRSQQDGANRQAKAERNLLTTGRRGDSKRTLLRSLLQNDIQRERSLTLQLLRYIVDCNYLQEQREVSEDKGGSTISADATIKG